MARLTKLSIEGFRSIRDPIEIRFPSNTPVVLVGENNAGKSNIVRAIDLILGESYPGFKEPEDHEYWDRTPSLIKIEASVTDFGGEDYRGAFNVESFVWKYDPDTVEGDRTLYRAVTADREIKPSNLLRGKLVCFAVGADRRLSWHLGYSSKWTMLSKLMHMFHTRLVCDEDRVEMLREKFNDIKGIFNEVEEFGNFQTALAEQFGEMFGGMSYGLQVDFSAYDPSNFFHSLRMQAVEGNRIRTLEELGTGQEQLLALAFAHAYAKAFYGGIFLAIEEPEAHLHPLAQEWLAKKVRQMCTDGLQLMLTTHSPAFVDLLGLSGCVLVQKTEGATTVQQLGKNELVEYCVQHGSHPARTQLDTILPFYSGSATHEIKAGLFAKKIVLVEGLTESLSVPVYLGKVDLDVTKEGIAVIPVMGKGNLAKWWRFFTAYEVPTYILFDNDDENDEEGRRRADILKAIGIDEPAITEIIEQQDWSVGAFYSVFGENFENTMRASFGNYGAFEAEAREQLGDSKPLVARYVADKLTRDEAQIGWQRVAEMATALRGLSIP